MGALLSSVLAPIALPLGSFLAIPMLSSWSTGLNLIFLSVAWTTIAASYSPLQLELVAPLVLRLSLYIIPSLIFLLFDIGVPSLAVEFKSQGQWGIPSNQKGGARAVRRVIAWSCANVLLTVALQAGIEFLITDILQMRSLLLIKGSKWGLNHLPNPWTMVKHGIIGLVSRNVSYLDHIRPVNRANEHALDPAILCPYTLAALTERRSTLGLASRLASQRQDPILLRCKLRPSHLPPLAPLSPPLPSSDCSTDAYPYLFDPDRYLQSGGDICVLWLQCSTLNYHVARYGATC